MWKALSQANPPEPAKHTLPLCLSNPAYKSALQQFSKQLSAENQTEGLQALLIGSGHRKLTPPDTDLLILTNEPAAQCVNYIKEFKWHFNSLSRLTRQEQQDFYDKLPPQSITRVIAALCSYHGVKITKSYTKNNRSLITLDFGANTYIDLNLYNGLLEDHTQNSDFSINTLYFDITTNEYIHMHPNAITDINAKRLRAAGGNVRAMFQRDITTLFRAIRIITTEDYKAKQFLPAIKSLPSELPNAIQAMNPDRLTADKISIFCSGYAAKTLDFLEEHQLFDYLFPESTSEHDTKKEEKLFLFRKIAEASDALYHRDITNPNYPHELAKYFERKNSGLKENKKKKLILCLFDHALSYTQSLQKKFDNEKYSIYNHNSTQGFYDMEAYIHDIEHIGFEIIAHNFESLLKKKPITDIIENDSSSIDETTIEGESSDSESDTRPKESEKNHSIEQLSDKNIVMNLETKQDKNELHEDKPANLANKENEIVANKKKKKKRKTNKKEDDPKPLSLQEQEILNIYSAGVDHFSKQQYEEALPFLKKASANEVCKQTLQEKIDALLEINDKKITAPPKVSLALAIMLDAVGKNNDAIKYYQKFLAEKIAFNLFPDEHEPHEPLSKFSFIYLRLMILFREISNNTKDDPKPLSLQEQEILNIYSAGVDHFSKQQYEEALPFLKKASANEVCKQTLQKKIDASLEINDKKITAPPKVSLALAIMLDAVGKNNDAIKYYQKFLAEKIAFNLFPDEHEPHEPLSKFSFIYLRLMILFREISNNTKKADHKKLYQIIAEKYRNEIILSPMISKDIKSQESDYTKMPCPPTPPHKNSKDGHVLPIALTLKEWFNEANNSFDRGLYFNASICYYNVFNLLKNTNPKESIAPLIRKIMVCYMQLEMHEQSFSLLLNETSLDLRREFMKDDYNQAIYKQAVKANIMKKKSQEDTGNISSNHASHFHSPHKTSAVTENYTPTLTET